MFSLDYYKIVRVPTSRGRDAIFIGIFTAGAHENIFLGEESSPLVTSPLSRTSLASLRVSPRSITPDPCSCTNSSCLLQSNSSAQIRFTWMCPRLERSKGSQPSINFLEEERLGWITHSSIVYGPSRGWDKNRYHRVGKPSAEGRRKVYYRKHAIVASISDIVILRWRRLPKISLRERKGEENDGGL